MEKQEFSPPRHWISTDELNEHYWSDPSTLESRGQEFLHKPIETLEAIEKSSEAGIARRDFLTIMGASMAMASLSCARKPVTKIIPYVVRPETIIPGVATWYATSCTGCSAGCGILAKDREARPIKLEGNPSNPLTAGKLCTRGQASLLDLYDPERLRGPFKNARGSNSPETATWEQVDAEILSKLKSAGRVRVLTHPTTSPSRKRVIEEFLGSFRDGAWIEYEANGFDDIAQAQLVSYGESVFPNYRFDQAHVVVSLGFDFLGTGFSPVEHARQWAERRKLDAQDPGRAVMSKFYCFEPNLSVTGSNADERHAIKPGDELKIAMALANLLADRAGFGSDSSLSQVLSSFNPKAVAQEVGGTVTAAKLTELAGKLWESRGKALVVGGGLGSRVGHGIELQIAVNLLNEMLDSEGATIDGVTHPRTYRGSTRDFLKLFRELGEGSVDVVVIDRVNPVYLNAEWAEKLKKAKLVVFNGTEWNETADFSDFVLGDHHALENWGDTEPARGVFGLQQPTVAPLGGSRAFESGLIAWTKKLGSAKLASRVSEAAEKSWHEYVRENWRETRFASFGGGKTFDAFWFGALQDGVVSRWVKDPSGRRTFKRGALGQLQSMRKSKGEILLALYSKVAMGDGRHANNSWLQELPDPVSQVTWDNYLNVSPKLAKEMGLKDGDRVKLDLDGASMDLPAHIQPGMHAQVVSLAIGYGRTRVGKVGTNSGFNAFPAVKWGGMDPVFSGQKVKLTRTGARFDLASAQGHHQSENRPVLNDVTLAAYREDARAASHTDPHLRMNVVPTMWEEHSYKGYRWGMTIDLTTCTGCSACVIACQAENNIPVVGRSGVRVSREMHWIRIDRYYSGSEDNPDVIFQPMLCQHCENAPCETVCPVLATTHSDEGLNDMTYNRCVGTRYCQNNCPYKVRRFNFFDHWKDYQGTQNLVWNPDVTVRQRGIMEKCTFCVQRIQKAKDVVKEKGGRVMDRDLKTACQQTCPTDAITFGDIHNPESQVSLLRWSARGFRALEVLNTKPSVTYLTKVRNKDNAHHG